jgi:Cys-tRNA(Pro)/Cys-tRNA(Cys) deacylase
MPRAARLAGVLPAYQGHGAACADAARAALRYTAAMSKTTRATLQLEDAGVAFEVRTYDYDPDADKVGLQAAAALGVPPSRVYKTLLANVDGRPVCAIVPSDREVNMKRLAAAAGGKHAQMLAPADAERVSGYHVGGISPFGMRRRVPAVLDELAFGEARIYVNGGQRGLQVELSPDDVLRVLDARRASIVG